MPSKTPINAITIVCTMNVSLAQTLPRLSHLGGINDLLQTGHSERYVHARNAGEMEGLERHLRTGL